MAFFSRARSKRARVPDDLAALALAEYHQGHYAAAVRLYGEAIDALHALCAVIGPSARIRTPSSRDQPILDGFVDSLAAALANNAPPQVSAIVVRTAANLRDISAAAGTEAARYLVAAGRAELIYRRGGS
jgi:hypothetical protein